MLASETFPRLSPDPRKLSHQKPQLCEESAYFLVLVWPLSSIGSSLSFPLSPDEGVADTSPGLELDASTGALRDVSSLNRESLAD